MQQKQAMAAGLVAFGWYAMPDVIRSRGARIAAKSALLAGFTAVALRKPEEPGAEEGTHSVEEQMARAEAAGLKPWMAVAGLGLLGGSLATSGVIERKIFARGERRRAEGVVAAHTRLALVAGALGAAAALVDE